MAAPAGDKSAMLKEYAPQEQMVKCAAAPGTTASAMTRAAFLLIALSLAPLELVAQEGVDKLPVLNWPVPREWLNVKAGCGGGGVSSTMAAAVGDGVVDDTAAIQACFDQVSNETGL